MGPRYARRTRQGRSTCALPACAERFEEARGDVDFLVEFRRDAPTRLDAYFGLEEALDALPGRPVDLVAPVALENPYFAASVGATGHELYAV